MYIIITEVTLRKSQFNLTFYISLFLVGVLQVTEIGDPELHCQVYTSHCLYLACPVQPDPALQLPLGVGRTAVLPGLNIVQSVSV